MIGIRYGAASAYIDVTEVALQRFCDGDRVYIPRGDHLRASVFGDPAPGTAKDVEVLYAERPDLGGLFGPYDDILVPLPVPCRPTPPPRTVQPPPRHLQYLSDRIDFVHRQLIFTGGSLDDELPEQRMAVRHIGPDARVLELGANIGRNTLMIASLLAEDANLVTLECDPVAVAMLRNNRFANGMGFQIEPSALSYRKLMQAGWETLPSEELREGYRWVPTITYEDLVAKYPIAFDTLVADCEGALYFILADNDAILDGINTVILESDYLTAEHKHSVEEIFARYGLRRVHSEPVEITWSHNFPPECVASFFEVWKRSPEPS